MMGESTCTALPGEAEGGAGGAADADAAAEDAAAEEQGAPGGGDCVDSASPALTSRR